MGPKTSAKYQKGIHLSHRQICDAIQTAKAKQIVVYIEVELKGKIVASQADDAVLNMEEWVVPSADGNAVLATSQFPFLPIQTSCDNLCQSPTTLKGRGLLNLGRGSINSR